MFGWDDAAAIAVPLITGAIGNSQASSANKDVNSQLNEILSMYQNIATPDIEKLKLDLANYQNVADYNPQEMVAEQLGATDALQNVNLDPRLKAQQNKALDLYSQIASGGFTPEMQIAMDAERRQNEAGLTSNLKRLQQQQQERGVSSSDFALAQQVAEAQSAANRQAEDNAKMRAAASQNALNAIAQGANLAGSMESADYARQAALANSLNSRELTNLNQRAATQKSNVDAFNQALAAKSQNAQNISNLNTQQSNTQQQYNKNLAQQDYENQLKKANLISGARTGLANQRSKEGQATRDQWAGIGSGLSTIGTSLMKKGT